MALGGSTLEIGYLEKAEPWKLESRYFPSKVGGKPAWLDLKNINIDLKCGYCSKPCIFLCQVYAPLGDELGAYHRTIFIFMCRDVDCSKRNENKNFLVYRCQLYHSNEFYSMDEPEDRPDWCKELTVEKYCRTCVVCGCFAPNQCSKCKITKYCSREHQLLDWKSGHKDKCGTLASGSAEILFPEFEIINESEIIDDEDAEMLKKPDEKSDEEKMMDYERYISEHKAATLNNVDPKLLEDLYLCKEDKYFKKFRERLKICPDQVIRYDRGGEPLYISNPNLTSNDIPKCELCQGPRDFEFQVLPTLLNSLNVDSLDKSIDWGTLLVYTCRNSCGGSSSYKKEFLLKQDPDE